MLGQVRFGLAGYPVRFQIMKLYGRIMGIETVLPDILNIIFECKLGQVRFGPARCPVRFRISGDIIFEYMLGQFRFGLGLRSRSDFTGYYIDDDMYAVTLQCPGLVYKFFFFLGGGGTVAKPS